MLSAQVEKKNLSAQVMAKSQQQDERMSLHKLLKSCESSSSLAVLREELWLPAEGAEGEEIVTLETARA